MPLTFQTNDDDIDISGADTIAGLKTFANLPFVDCFSGGDAEGQLYDIAIFGAPHDTSWARVVDCGDARLTWLDNTVSLKRLDKAHKGISGRPAANSAVSVTPRILALGGDHTTTLSALRSTYEKWGPVSVIHFDSHIDTWDPSVLGGGISDYAGLNHVTARDLDKLGAQGVISKIKERVGDSKVYISVDIDVLDPAFAPGETTVLAAAEVAYSLIDLMVTTPVKSKADLEIGQ
ncbi:putative agmatinase 1 [Colletotrichum sp. SAR11_240]|nr:putative agmatinase 1 [Colletotrichum sp. SAR11_240]